MISICVVTGGRRSQLRSCLASLVAQDDAPPWELLVCMNGDPTVEGLIRELVPSALIASVAPARLGAARNILVERATGELLLFLDDDVVAEPHLLRRLGDLAASEPTAGVFGGPNLTPPGSSRFEVVQGAVLASIVGAGPVRRRYGAHPSVLADERWFTLCNLAVRRSLMVRFPPELTGGEENAVLVELAREHVPMRYDPDLVVYHERRRRLRPFARQMVKYGYGRGEVITRDPSTVRLPYLLPSLLLAYLAVLPLAMLASLAALLPAAVYSLAVVASGVKIAWPLRRAGAALVAMGLTVVMHVSYGVGVCRGLVRRRRREIHAAAEWCEVPAST
jgi:succinoglycan biosynthesis protein ExoA